MRNEADFTNYIQNRLADAEIFADTQSSHVAELDGALRTASKSQTGNAGYPDHIALIDDFVLVMEDKSDRLKLVLRDGGEISQTVDATQNYALNGALFYALKILDGTRYKKVFAFGNAGDCKHHIIKPIFIDAEKNIKELPEVDTFKNFTAENINAYYRRMVLGEESAEELELRKILRRAEILHEYLRNYGQLGEDEKPLVVSAILLALAESRHGFNIEQLTGDKIDTDGAKIFDKVETHLKRAQVRSEVKKDRVLHQFSLIKDRPLLNDINRTLEKTPLKFFTEFIADNIFDAVVNNSAEDYLGRFYGEFISYSGGDGQSLGVVLTPRHIAELFCDLVNLKPDDVVFDPCCGTGSFLITAMSRMLQNADEARRKHIKTEQIHGIEAREDMFSIATTNMILRGDGQSNLVCGDFFAHNADDLQLLGNGLTVGFMNPPYSQAKNAATAHLSELRFILHLLESITRGGRVAVIVPVSAMIGKSRDDKDVKGIILRGHTLEGVISLNKNTFYRIGVVPCIAVFTAGEPHPAGKRVKFINFEDDGFEVKKHIGLVETERAKDRKSYLLDCWRGNVNDAPSKFMVETTIDAGDEWLHSFYYYNDELPTADDFDKTVADYLTFEFNMIAHGRGYLFGAKKNCTVPLTEPLPLHEKPWRPFVIGNLFNVEIGKAIDGNKVDKTSGHYAYITRKENTNGLDGFIDYDETFLNKNFPAITVGNETAQPYVQDFPFYTGTKVNILSPKTPLSRFTLIFIAQSLRVHKEKYSYSFTMNSTRLKKQPILLPVTDDGAPDFDYMAAYVRAVEEKILQRYRNYINTAELWGGAEPKIIPFSKKPWRSFRLTDIFSIRATASGIDKIRLTLHEGKFPYITRSNCNNGIQTFICEQKNYNTDKGNCITVGLDTQTAFYQPIDFYTGQNIQILTNDQLNVHIARFLLPLLKNTLSIFSWGGNGATLTRLRRSKILLPVTDDGAPDFDYMAAYVQRIEAEKYRRYLEYISLNTEANQ